MATSSSKRAGPVADDGAPQKNLRAERIGLPKGVVMGFFAEKGGTGKSTLCHTAASYLRNLANKEAFPDEKDRFRVLAIDADPQNNLSVFNTPPAILSKYTDPGPDANAASPRYRVTINDLLTGKFWPDDLEADAFHCNGIDRYHTILGREVPNRTEKQLLDQLDPSSDLVETVASIVGRVASLADHYDAILIDFNPTYSAVNRILLACCDVLFNIVTLDLMCIQAFPKLRENLHEICALRSRMNKVSFLAQKRPLRCFVVPNMVRVQANVFPPSPIQLHALCIDRMKRGLVRRDQGPGARSPRFTLDMSTVFVPRCDNLLNHIHTLASDQVRPGNGPVQAFWNFVYSTRDMLLAALSISQDDSSIRSPRSDDLSQSWTWTKLDQRNPPGQVSSDGNLFLYCIEFPDCYKIGKTANPVDRQKVLAQAASNRLAEPIVGKVVFLYESDAKSITSVEAILHRYLLPTCTGTNEYYRKEYPIGQPNRVLTEIIQLMDEAQNGQSNDFCLELACNELKTGRAAFRRARIRNTSALVAASSSPASAQSSSI